MPLRSAILHTANVCWTSSTQSIYRIMGDVFPADKAHPCYIITPDTDFELHFGKPANKKRKLYNGMIQCNLMSYYQD